MKIPQFLTRTLQASMLEVMITDKVYESCADVSVKFLARKNGDNPENIYSDELMRGVQSSLTTASLNCFVSLDKSQAYQDFLNKTEDLNLFLDLGQPGHPNLDQSTNFKVFVECKRPECENNTGLGLTFLMFYNVSRVEKNTEPSVIKNNVLIVNMEKRSSVVELPVAMY